MSFIRPSPPDNYFDQRSNQIGNEVNSRKIVAGQGINVTKGAAGTTISVNDTGESAFMRFKGAYSPTASYHPNDVVVVASQSYYDATGSLIPVNTGSTYKSGSIVPGTYVANYFVPDGSQTISLFESTIAPYYSNAGMTIDPDLANTFRDTSINSYYPTQPVNTASMALVAQSTWQATANIPFWSPIAVSSAASSSSPAYYTINTSAGLPEVYGTYFVGINDFGQKVRIAKNYKLRCNIPSASIYGNTVTYTYTSGSSINSVFRTVTLPNGFVETQRVSPPYLAGDEVWAMPVSNLDADFLTGSVSDSVGSGSLAITWVDMNIDARTWKSNVNQTGP